MRWIKVQISFRCENAMFAGRGQGSTATMEARCANIFFKHFLSDRTISLPISSRRRSLRNAVPGLPVLPGVLPSFSPVWLQRHLLLHQGRQLRGHPQDQEELPVLQIQVRTFKKDDESAARSYLKCAMYRSQTS